MPSPTPSSSTAGFFQQLPVVLPQYTSPHLSTARDGPPDDAIITRILKQYLPSASHNDVGKSMHDLSRLVLTPEILRHAVEAETVPPFLQPLTTFGEVNRNDPLVTCQGWKALKAVGMKARVVSTAYDKSLSNHNRRLHQFIVNHNWHHTSTLTMCPMTMTDGSASLLSKHLEDSDGPQPGRKTVLNEYYRRLVSNNPDEAWTSGQWMTERSGGSDVRGTETIATKLADSGDGQDVLGQPLGPWSIDGFKWFSSATDSDMTMLLAQTSKGLSAFCVPMRRKAGAGSELNGIRIQRLKNKMGTKGLPTAELELIGARGWLLGEEGKGVREISTILNITRLHTGAGSISYWSRGLSICRAYTKARKVRGAYLYENPQHVYWMAGETVKYWAAASLTFFGVALLGCSEQGVGVMAKTPSAALITDDASARALLRILTPVIKAQVSTSAVSGLRANMECLGGVGYCENHEDGGILNLAKIFRDSVVQTIWEGTVSVMADDVGRVLKDKRIAGGRIIEDVFAPWVQRSLTPCRKKFAKKCAAVDDRLESLTKLVARVKADEALLEYSGRWLLEHIEAIATAVLLLHDATIDGDEVASYVAARYVRSHVAASTEQMRGEVDWKTEAAIDLKIFLGDGVSPKVSREKL
ncbi:acyl-CoA dehydrogenase/oxidase [Plectosphaerella plurivora]|uniref:Acyl-CoA dehydrogenase/oxidase n=1 Tax=Plectosphaerella plurivora TaxID=936078 RepID=A0A9P8VJP8_9PEZI|nr:acyl-CoA dehydrogenase/oxidase [Plectosphaerella plurivora]